MFFSILAVLICIATSNECTRVYINEFHYDNFFRDSQILDFVEIAGPAGTNLDGYQIMTYNGEFETVCGNGICEDGWEQYSDANLGVIVNCYRDCAGFDNWIFNSSYVIPEVENGMGVLVVYMGEFLNNEVVDDLPAGLGDGLLLVNPDGEVVQFVTYEATASHTAENSVSPPLDTTNVTAVHQKLQDLYLYQLPGVSIQLQGQGFCYEDFKWEGPGSSTVSTSASTPGDVNHDQIFDALPTVAPSVCPSLSPSFDPSTVPTGIPSVAPSLEPSLGPSFQPSQPPSVAPSKNPSVDPSKGPTTIPSVSPSMVPSKSPSVVPSKNPTAPPSKNPSTNPSFEPSVAPSLAPSTTPSYNPSVVPTVGPSLAPTSAEPTTTPSVAPSFSPSLVPSTTPSTVPSKNPTFGPSKAPSVPPSDAPTVPPSCTPSTAPSKGPSVGPSVVPSRSPSLPPTTSEPSTTPSYMPSVKPFLRPTTFPSTAPSNGPSIDPTFGPSVGPSVAPSCAPSTGPTVQPSNLPSTTPSVCPSLAPSLGPSLGPSTQPSTAPSTNPSLAPSTSPSKPPSTAPSTNPSFAPSTTPSIAPSTGPSVTPSAPPSTAPSISPTIEACATAMHRKVGSNLIVLNSTESSWDDTNDQLSFSVHLPFKYTVNSIVFEGASNTANNYDSVSNTDDWDYEYRTEDCLHVFDITVDFADIQDSAVVTESAGSYYYTGSLKVTASETFDHDIDPSQSFTRQVVQDLVWILELEDSVELSVDVVDIYINDAATFHVFTKYSVLEHDGTSSDVTITYQTEVNYPWVLDDSNYQFVDESPYGIPYTSEGSLTQLSQTNCGVGFADQTCVQEFEVTFPVSDVCAILGNWTVRHFATYESETQQFDFTAVVSLESVCATTITDVDGQATLTAYESDAFTTEATTFQIGSTAYFKLVVDDTIQSVNSVTLESVEVENMDNTYTCTSSNGELNYEEIAVSASEATFQLDIEVDKIKGDETAIVRANIEIDYIDRRERRVLKLDLGGYRQAWIDQDSDKRLLMYVDEDNKVKVEQVIYITEAQDRAADHCWIDGEEYQNHAIYEGNCPQDQSGTLKFIKQCTDGVWTSVLNQCATIQSETLTSESLNNTESNSVDWEIVFFTLLGVTALSVFLYGTRKACQRKVLQRGDSMASKTSTTKPVLLDIETHETKC